MLEKDSRMTKEQEREVLFRLAGMAFRFAAKVCPALSEYADNITEGNWQEAREDALALQVDYEIELLNETENNVIHYWYTGYFPEQDKSIGVGASISALHHARKCAFEAAHGDWEGAWGDLCQASSYAAMGGDGFHEEVDRIVAEVLS